MPNNLLTGFLFRKASSTATATAMPSRARSQQGASIPSAPKPGHSKLPSTEMGMTEPWDSRLPAHSEVLRKQENGGRRLWGWLEEMSVTLIKDSSSVSIESVQKSAEQVKGGGREWAAGHEVERNDGEDNPSITLELRQGETGQIWESAQGPWPSRSARSRG